MARKYLSLTVIMLILIIVLGRPSCSASIDLYDVTNTSTPGGYIDFLVNTTSISSKLMSLGEAYLFIDDNGLALIGDNAYALLGYDNTFFYKHVINIGSGKLVFYRVRLPASNDFLEWLDKTSGRHYLKIYAGIGRVIVSNGFSISRGDVHVIDTDKVMNISYYKIKELNTTRHVMVMIGLDRNITGSISLAVMASSAGSSRSLESMLLNPDVSIANNTIVINGNISCNIPLNPTGMIEVQGYRIPYEDYNITIIIGMHNLSHTNLTRIIGPPGSNAEVVELSWNTSRNKFIRIIQGSDIREYWDNSIFSSNASIYFISYGRLILYPSVNITYKPPQEPLSLGSLETSLCNMPSNTFITRIVFLRVDREYRELTSIWEGLSLTNASVRLTERMPYAPYGGEPVKIVVEYTVEDPVVHGERMYLPLPGIAKHHKAVGVGCVKHFVFRRNYYYPI